MTLRSGWRSLRKVGRILGVVGVTSGIYVTLRSGLLLRAGKSPARAAARVRWQGRVYRAWARMLLKVLGVRVTWEGPAPEPPFLLAANHLGYLDILVLGSRLPLTFVAKAEIASWPVIGHICQKAGTVFLERERKSDLLRALEVLDAALANGAGIAFFPEGTSSIGTTVLPFRSPLLALAARSGRPVWAASLAYRTPPQELPAHLSVCWWGDAPFLPHVKVLVGLAEIHATVSLAPEPFAHEDRKQLASALREAVVERFVPSAPDDATAAL